MLKEDYITILSQPKKVKVVEKIIKKLENQNESDTIQWDFKQDKPINNKLHKIELRKGKLHIVNLF